MTIPYWSDTTAVPGMTEAEISESNAFIATMEVWRIMCLTDTTNSLWHGNDDPPKDSDYIEFITPDEYYSGKAIYYQGSLYEDGEKITHVWKDVSQWRLA